MVAHVQESSARFIAQSHGACALKLEQVQGRVVAIGSMLQLLEDAHNRLNASQPADKHPPVKVAVLGSDSAAKALGSSFDDRLNARIKEAELLAAGAHTAALTSSEMASQLTALRKLLRLAFVEVSDNLLRQLWPTTLSFGLQEPGGTLLHLCLHAMSESRCVREVSSFTSAANHKGLQDLHLLSVSAWFSFSDLAT